MKLNPLLLDIKKNLFIIFCLLFLLTLCVYQTVLRKRESNLINQQNDKIHLNYDKEYLFEDLKFTPQTIDSLNTLKKNKLFVLRFRRNDCKECVDSIFKNTIKISSKIGKENMAVLFDDTNLLNYYKYKRLYQNDIVNFFYFPDMISDLDKRGVSYYFVYSARNSSSSLSFLTQPLDFPQHTNSYLKTLENVF